MEERPVALSRAFVHGLLRGRMEHEGLVIAGAFSDPLLAGWRREGELAEAVCGATVDVVELGADLGEAADSYEAFVRAQEADKAQDDLATDSEKRLRAWRERVLLGRPAAPPPGLVGGHQHKHLALGLIGRGRP